MHEGRNYAQLALPAFGWALPYFALDALIGKAYRDRLDELMVCSYVLLSLMEFEAQLLDQGNELNAKSKSQND